MMFTLQVVTKNNSSSSIALTAYPAKCPRCHHAINPIFRSGCLTAGGGQASLAFQCPNCEAIFVTEYDKNLNNSYYYPGRSEPIYFVETSFSDEIKSISPTFSQVYNQALAAESNGLDQLTGIGLRKALEFLIKDFSISRNKKEEEKIKNLTLQQCISQFIEDKTLVGVAERAVWLANDETHYLRKWLDKDIQDLKELTRITINMIENTLIGERYIAEMQRP